MHAVQALSQYPEHAAVTENVFFVGPPQGANTAYHFHPGDRDRPWSADPVKALSPEDRRLQHRKRTVDFEHPALVVLDEPLVLESTAMEDDVLVICHAFRAPKDLIRAYDIDVEKMANWLLAIAAGYYDVPYHHWGHAMDTFFFTCFMMAEGQVASYFTWSDMLAIQMAAIGHDVGHLGVNNAFLVATNAELAIRYNDLSPLENMHACVLFEKLRKPGLNFLSHLTMEDFSGIRGKVISAVLATDMARHFEHVDKMRCRSQKVDELPMHEECSKDISNEVFHEDGGQVPDRPTRRLLLASFLHLADLGSSCRTWPSHSRNVVMLEEEFFAQGDTERGLGIPVMPMMDRTKDSLACGQAFFLTKMVLPLVEVCGSYMHAKVEATLQENLQNNIEGWDDLIEQYGKQSAAALVGKVVESKDSGHTFEDQPSNGKKHQANNRISNSSAKVKIYGTRL